jgi:hypothetical protein
VVGKVIDANIYSWEPIFSKLWIGSLSFLSKCMDYIATYVVNDVRVQNVDFHLFRYIFLTTWIYHTLTSQLTFDAF